MNAIKKYIRHFRRWNIWRKRCINGPAHKLLVLIGFFKSPTMEYVLLPEEIAEIKREVESVEFQYCGTYLQSAVESAIDAVAKGWAMKLPKFPPGDQRLLDGLSKTDIMEEKEVAQDAE